MIAEVEKPDGTYEKRDMGEPVCMQDFCDTCGDCLYCYRDDCYRGDYCGCPRWVIYMSNPKNPFREQ